jgi:hypothetical protein
MIVDANAKVTIDTYLYDPGMSRGSALLDLAKGAFRFTTGKVAALTQKNITITSNFVTLSSAVA